MEELLQLLQLCAVAASCCRKHWIVRACVDVKECSVSLAYVKYVFTHARIHVCAYRDMHVYKVYVSGHARHSPYSGNTSKLPT